MAEITNFILIHPAEMKYVINNFFAINLNKCDMKSV